jgi:hypothetical protein
LWTRCFGEDVCDLMLACNVTDFRLPILNKMTNLVISDVKVCKEMVDLSTLVDSNEMLIPISDDLGVESA